MAVMATVVQFVSLTWSFLSPQVQSNFTSKSCMLCGLFKLRYNTAHLFAKVCIVSHQDESDPVKFGE